MTTLDESGSYVQGEGPMSLNEAMSVLCEFERRYPQWEPMEAVCDPNFWAFVDALPEAERTSFQRACAAFADADRDGTLARIQTNAVAVVEMTGRNYSEEELFRAANDGVALD